MNKFGLFLALSTLCSFSAVATEVCSVTAKDLFTGIDFVDMKDRCTVATENQIKMEITASLKYLSMGAYFSKDSVNRPGFAKLFFDAASEEREHAHKLIEYLNMRGRYMLETDGDWKQKISDINIKKLVEESEKPGVAGLAELSSGDSAGLIALQNALKLEVAVTKSIRDLVAKCESDDAYNHYHFVDYLTGEFLEEQYKGQRDLAGKISTLGKMVKGDGARLAEFLFDKQLL